MTTQQLYQKTINEEMSSSDFLWNVRRNPQYYNIINGLMSFEDTVNVLKGRGHIWENNEDSAVKPFNMIGVMRTLNEAKKPKKEPKLTADMVNYYEFTKGWKKELEKTDDLDKAKEKAIANIAKDPNYYTRLEMQAYQKSKNKKEPKNLPIDISKKNANYKDDANQMQKLDKTKPKSNVDDSLAKKEKAKSKSAGLKSMKGGYPQMKKINEDADSDYQFNKNQEERLKNIKTGNVYNPASQYTPEEIAKRAAEREKLEKSKEQSKRDKQNKEQKKEERKRNIVIPKKISDLPSGYKIEVELYYPLRATRNVFDPKTKETKVEEKLIVVPKNRIDTTGEYKGLPDTDSEKVSPSTGRWRKKMLTKEQIIDFHKNFQKEQIDIDQNPLYNVVKVSTNWRNVPLNPKNPDITYIPPTPTSWKDSTTKQKVFSNEPANEPAASTAKKYYVKDTQLSKIKTFDTKKEAINYAKEENKNNNTKDRFKVMDKSSLTNPSKKQSNVEQPSTSANREIYTSDVSVDKIDVDKYKYFVVDFKPRTVRGYNDEEYAKKTARLSGDEFMDKNQFINYKNPKTEPTVTSKEDSNDEKLKDFSSPKYKYFVVNTKLKETEGFENKEDALKYLKSVTIKKIGGSNEPTDNASDFKYMDKKQYLDWNDRRMRELKLKQDYQRKKGLLESIIRKKVKRLLQENEIGKYIGVEGPDVKKKD